MRRRDLGGTGLIVSELGFGCARLGGIFQNQPQTEAISLLHEALESGINFFDTSDLYCQGESEELLGRAFADRRDEVIFATKVGYCLPSRRRVAAQLKPLVRPVLRRLGLRRSAVPAAVRGELSQDFSEAHIRSALDQSLRRLHTDHIDLYQLHSPPTAVLERGEFLNVLEQLRQAGKIRAYGVSCETTEDAAICLRYPQIAVLQLRVNLLDQSALSQVLPQAQQQGVAVVARECFAGGLLAKLTHGRNAGNARDEDLRAWEAEAARQGRSLPELALGFVTDLDGVCVSLVGMRTRSHLMDAIHFLAAWHSAGSPVGAEEAE